jgi:DNA-binding protein H-NS
MARQDGFDKMSYAELTALRHRIDRLIAEKQDAARSEARKKMTNLAKEHGVSLDDMFGRGGKGKGKGSVAVKYRDPKNPGNTWAGRGRMPRWMAEATKAGKKKEDFLV